MGPKHRFIPNRKNLPPVPGSPSLNDEEILGDPEDSSGSENRGENPNSEYELEVVTNRNCDTFRTAETSGTSDTYVTGTGTSSSTSGPPWKRELRKEISSRVKEPETESRGLSKGQDSKGISFRNLGSRGPSRNQNSREASRTQTPQKMSSKSFVRTPSRTSGSQESGYQTSTQKSDLTPASPAVPMATLQNETLIQMTGRASGTSIDRPASLSNSYQALPKVFCETLQGSGKFAAKST